MFPRRPDRLDVETFFSDQADGETFPACLARGADTTSTWKHSCRIAATGKHNFTNPGGTVARRRAWWYTAGPSKSLQKAPTWKRFANFTVETFFPKVDTWKRSFTERFHVKKRFHVSPKSRDVETFCKNASTWKRLKNVPAVVTWKRLAQTRRKGSTWKRFRTFPRVALRPNVSTPDLSETFLRSA